MKIFYNSKLAKLLTIIGGTRTIMLFGMVFTEDSKLSDKTIVHESAHCKQYYDCLLAGVIISTILCIILSIFKIFSWWYLIFIFFSISLFYILYGIEWVVNRIKGLNAEEAYLELSFEKQAIYVAKQMDLKKYIHFGWWKY